MKNKLIDILQIRKVRVITILTIIFTMLACQFLLPIYPPTGDSLNFLQIIGLVSTIFLIIFTGLILWSDYEVVKDKLDTF